MKNKLMYMLQLLLFSQFGLIYLSHSQDLSRTQNSPVCDSTEHEHVCLELHDMNSKSS